MSYHSTRDLCQRFRCSSRTLFRRMKRPQNPFPTPCIRHAGSFNLWDARDVAAWEARERAQSRQDMPEEETTS
jgi:hypothetical protein